MGTRKTYVGSLRLPIRELRHRRVGGGLREGNGHKGSSEDDGSAHVDDIEWLLRKKCFVVIKKLYVVVDYY